MNYLQINRERLLNNWIKAEAKVKYKAHLGVLKLMELLFYWKV